MIYKIIMNLILGINIFLYGMENDEYFSKKIYPILIRF